MNDETKVEFNFDVLPITVTYAGDFSHQTKWPHDAWNVCIKSKDGDDWHTTYKTGLGHRKGKYPPQPVKPDNKSIMYSLLLDADAGNENFDDWCFNYGFDNDSIKALNMYKECLAIYANLHKTFNHAQLTDMREALQDY